ncbi:MAG: amino acid ABC transporter permease [Hyphomicrobiaceae bacterium]|nr:MAG: amino acid ABC transporter permease [Hyphomicrobiaceae bacterium]
MRHSFDVDYIIAAIPSLMNGLLMTVIVSLISISLAVLIGIAGAAARVFNTPIAAPLAKGYVEFIRNTPLLVQIFFIFFGLPSLGLKLPIFWSGVVALTVWGGAFNIENFRGGFLAVPKGLREAAMSLGLTRLQYLGLIAMPVGLRVSIPSVLNTAISTLKNSAYLQAIGLAELTFVAMDRLSIDFRTLEMFASIGLIYLVLVIGLSAAVRAIERVLQRPFATE